MLRPFLSTMLFMLALPAFGQEIKIGVPYARFGFGASQCWYRHHFQETHAADTLLYFYDNGGKKATHAGLGLHAETGYCFARPFRLGVAVRARVYLENTTQLPGIYTWFTAGPTAEYYFREDLSMFARVHALFDTQFRGAVHRFSWGAGLGVRYIPQEINHLSISLSAEYVGTKGTFIRYQLSPVSETSARIEQSFRNAGFLLEFGLNVEL
jgi:hypothetical protein